MKIAPIAIGERWIQACHRTSIFITWPWLWQRLIWRHESAIPTTAGLLVLQFLFRWNEMLKCLLFVCVTGRLGGYRAMRHLLIRKHHLTASHEMVRCILRQMDPVGVEDRRCHRLRRRTYTSRGPNHTWHVDGYDKLRPYGILISG